MRGRKGRCGGCSKRCQAGVVRLGCGRTTTSTTETMRKRRMPKHWRMCREEKERRSAPGKTSTGSRHEKVDEEVRGVKLRGPDRYGPRDLFVWTPTLPTLDPTPFGLHRIHLNENGRSISESEYVWSSARDKHLNTGLASGLQSSKSLD